MSQQRRKSRRARSQRHHNRRRQRGGDASNWAQAVYGNANAQHAGPGGVIQMNNLAGVGLSKGGVAHNAAPVVGGRSPHASPQQAPHMQGGKGIITDVAVPAVLL